MDFLLLHSSVPATGTISTLKMFRKKLPQEVRLTIVDMQSEQHFVETFQLLPEHSCDTLKQRASDILQQNGIQASLPNIAVMFGGGSWTSTKD